MSHSKGSIAGHHTPPRARRACTAGSDGCGSARVRCQGASDLQLRGAPAADLPCDGSRVAAMAACKS
eukprot:924627-Prymnesium_polylepis.1